MDGVKPAEGQLSLLDEKPAIQDTLRVNDTRLKLDNGFLLVDMHYPRAPIPSYVLHVIGQDGLIVDFLEAAIDLLNLRIFLRGQRIWIPEEHSEGVINRPNRLWNCIQCGQEIPAWQLKAWSPKRAESYCLRHVEALENVEEYRYRMMEKK